MVKVIAIIKDNPFLALRTPARRTCCSPNESWKFPRNARQTRGKNQFN